MDNCTNFKVSNFGKFWVKVEHVGVGHVSDRVARGEASACTAASLLYLPRSVLRRSGRTERDAVPPPQTANFIQIPSKLPDPAQLIVSRSSERSRPPRQQVTFRNSP